MSLLMLSIANCSPSRSSPIFLLKIFGKFASEVFGGEFLFLKIHFLRQIERLHQKDRHLRTRDRAIGTVDARTTAAGDAFSGKLFDPITSPVAHGHIGEDSSCGGR